MLPEYLNDCVHCGFCLPSCPTYQLWGEEMDSPRGRIQLMDLAVKGEIPVDAVFAGHMDACLGCMACVSACPSGVRYDRLIEAARPVAEREVPRTRADRLHRDLLFALFPYPRRLRAAALLGRVQQRLGADRLLARAPLPPRLRALAELMPPVPPARGRRPLPPFVRSRAAGTPRAVVALLTGCVQSVFFADVNRATARVLALEGCDVLVPRAQTCCGALEEHSGRAEDAARRARRLLDTLGRLTRHVDAFVVNVAGCGSHLKEYGELLADDPDYAERARAFAAKVKDVSEVLVGLGPLARRHPVEGRVAYHDACHLRHAQGVFAEPRELLGAVPGLELAELPDGGTCCGSAGVYNLLQPEAAAELGRRKAAAVREAAPDAVATGNPGCLLQLRRHLAGDGGRELPLYHPVQLLDASLRGGGLRLSDAVATVGAAPSDQSVRTEGTSP
ncbi:glycolate oxidase [Mangrovactinospora gilvigrisea]|uniref:Glycolate oxidase iron-sulfur subunit n=1 Tax=Mangrovactinospora gilvigrisea TaxID=1428644 RepID=A0A1J7BDB1_9ACTN|nr:heterodisulfide reductase-related iron-sulfur binding cluster [Mangrovactinospora gilvigrisea]OIV36638.1 glycolate oxidase [Mangrovactinospora gilvigrisea]